MALRERRTRLVEGTKDDLARVILPLAAAAEDIVWVEMYDGRAGVDSGGHRRLCVGAVCGRMAPRKLVSRFLSRFPRQFFHEKRKTQN